MTDLRNLRHVVTLARHLSYSRAAEALGLTQPALTRSIQVVEREIDIRLFDRDRAGVRLTSQGQQFVERANALLADVEDFDAHARRLATGEEGRIKFGMAPLPAWTLLPSALQERIGAAPELSNDVVVRNVDALWPLLIAGEIEFFVSAEEQVPQAPPVRAEVLGNFPITLLVRAGHPLLTVTRPARAFPLLVAAGSAKARAFPSGLGELGKAPVHFVEDYGTAISVTKTTDVIWISSAYAVADDLRSGALRALPHPATKFGSHQKMVLYSAERRTQSPGTLNLKEIFRKTIRHLSKAVR